MKECCIQEARLHLSKHHDVATCDDCGSLVLAYEIERDFKSTISELERLGLDYETTRIGKLFVIAKPQYG